MKLEQLFDFIHRLSKSEKRYFKLYEPQGKDASYIQLFDFMNDMDKYNELEVKDFLKAKFPHRTYAQVSNYLFEKMLGNLSNSRKMKGFNHHFQARYLLDNVLFLERKGYKDLATKYLNKVEQITQEYEMFNIELQVCSLKLNRLLATNLYDKNALEELETLKKKHFQTLKNYETITRYKYLLGEAMHWSCNYSDSVASKIDALLQDELMIDETLAKDYLSKYCYHMVFVLINNIQNKPLQILHHLENIHLAWKKDTNFYIDYFPMYFLNFQNYLKALVENNQLEKCKRLLPEFKQLRTEKAAKDAIGTIIVSYCTIQLIVVLKEDDWNKFNELKTVLWEDLKAHQAFLTKAQTVLFFNDLFPFLLRKKAYKDLLDWLEKMIALFDIDIYQDSLNENKSWLIFYLIAHHEVSPTSLYMSELRKILYRWRKSEKQQPVFSKLLNFFQKLISKKYQNSNHTVWAVIKKETQLIEAGLEENLHVEDSQLVDIMKVWLESK